MAILKDNLLEELDLLRDNLIEEEYQETGLINQICSDKVLKEIATKRPLKREDFLAISGIDKNFINRYADRFLRIIMKSQNASVKEVSVSNEAYKVLDHYKDRLTNISRRNQNLYMGKIVKHKNFDLSLLEINSEITNFLTNKRISVLELNNPEQDLESSLDRDIITLYRNVNKMEKETGSYDLYVGYPYAEGILNKDGFAIKAPLLYIPVKFKRNKRQFSLKKDKEKDIVLNRDLILAISKSEKAEIDLKVPYIDEVSKDTIEKIVIPFYEGIGMKFKKPSIEYKYEAFRSELKFNFLKQKKGVFTIKEYITLGRYKLYSSMIQKDINSILKNNRYNDLLEGLIEETNLYSKEIDSKFSMENQKIKESNLSYINEINYSQEKVIEMIQKEKKLVIWGPPGTGKSQTITNLIASSVLKGENVLVISEKKVALDVIHTRLGNASKYSMFIDDAENKQGFYDKLKNFIDPAPPQRTLNNDIYEIEKEIENIIYTMNQSIDLLYNHKIQGVPIHKLYQRYLKDKDLVDVLTPKSILKMFLNRFNEISFDDLTDIENKFDSKSSLIDYLEYHKIITEFSIIAKLDTKISRSNMIEFDEFTKRFLFYKKRYDKAWWFLTKRKIKNEIIAKRKGDIEFLFPKKTIEKQYFDILFKDFSLHEYIQKNISKLNKIETKYKQLTEKEVKFLDMLLFDFKPKEIEEKAKYLNYVFDAFYTGYLEDFKAKNQKYLYILDKYEEKLSELYNLLDKKKQVNIESFEMELYRNALNLSNTKRIMDIKRILESSHKISIKAFINTFQLELVNSIRIWMMTPEVVSAIVPLVYGMFDLVVIDEASQMYVEKGIPAIYRAKKVVIAGDTKQLRPSSLGVGRVEDEDIYQEDGLLKDISVDAKSLLDLARYKYKETILNYHYRSQYEELIAFSNYAFYEGKLIVSPNKKNPEKPPIEYIYVKDGIFDNRRNLEEGKTVVSLLRKILKERQNNESIGVITFNSTQRDLIENLIDEELYKRGKYQKIFETELFRKDDDEDKSLFVKNIENVQGDERDIIIFSVGYARGPDGIFRRQFGWLNNDGGQNRLNVAISRAKKKIYFVASMYPEEFKVDDLNSTGPKLLRDYMSYCYYVSTRKIDLAKEVLNKLHTKDDYIVNAKISELSQDIKKRLEKNHFIVDTGIGVGNYNIDLAIYDSDTLEYRLGILCDVEEGKLVDSRRDLIHGEKYLETRNWKLYRVFASNWYSDTNKEMRKIRDLLK
jgi:superfamily I DNA and/or RNA helicase